LDVVRSKRELQLRADALRAEGHRIALVPTMGALHSGHLSLVELARTRADRVWVSIFVNPTQFNQDSDFDGYPRDFEADLRVCRANGVDLVYAPEVADLYPDGDQTWVEVAELSAPLCGASRRGHFRGVATVVAKLLLAAKPHVAIFGEKDFQQLAIIRRMVRDLGIDSEIVGGPIVREPDGLALSSRNVHLGPEARAQAVALVEALNAAEAEVQAGERDRDALLARVRERLGKASLAAIDYAELRDPETLEPAPTRLNGRVLLALAVNFERGPEPDPAGAGEPVRLIDNRVLKLRD